MRLIKALIEWGKAVQEIRPGDVVWCPPGHQALARCGSDNRDG